MLNLEKEYAYDFGYPDKDLCFNIGSPGENNSMIGRKHTKEAKEKMSNKSKETWSKLEHKEKMSEMRKGEKNPFFGKHHTEESKEKMRQSSKGQVSGFKGKKHSKEAKEKMKGKRNTIIGEKNPNAKLTKKQVGIYKFDYSLPVKDRLFNGIEWAKAFNVKPHTIYAITIRPGWKLIQPDEQAYLEYKEELLKK